MESNFAKLNAIDVSKHTEKKNGLTYLSWAWAWGELKKVCPNAKYTVYENKDGWNYHTDGKTCWVKTGVTIDDLEYIEYLPVMDFRNKSIPADQVTSFDVNKTIQRSLTKAVARHGLGLCIYAGEDLPEATDARQPYAKQKDSTYDGIDTKHAKALKAAQTPEELVDVMAGIKASMGDAFMDVRNRYTVAYKARLAQIKGDK